MNVPLNLIGLALAMLVTLGWASLRTQRALHMLQLDSYANHRLLQWLMAEPASVGARRPNATGAPPSPAS